ncbi:MAG: hypothetical protein PWP08_508 [Methanofollis sp.]|nr:hypothetical protein [Methanofollis sp.]
MKEANVAIVRDIIASGNAAAVITTNQPYMILRKLYGEEGIDLSNVYFVDAITKYAVGKVPDDAVNTLFVNRPDNLTDMGIAITRTLKNAEGRSVSLLFDSVSTMLIYLSSVNISKFIHFVSSRLKILDVSGIFLSVEKGLDPLLLSQLTTFVDEVVDLDEIAET